MRATVRLLVAAATVVLLSVVGLVEAIRIDHLGLALVFSGAAVVGINLMLTARDRSIISLRGDLAHWANRTAAATGERPEHLVDRAVSAYRSRLGESDDNG